MMNPEQKKLPKEEVDAAMEEIGEGDGVIRSLDDLRAALPGIPVFEVGEISLEELKKKKDL